VDRQAVLLHIAAAASVLVPLAQGDGLALQPAGIGVSIGGRRSGSTA
jgi:hypothetical protein